MVNVESFKDWCPWSIPRDQYRFSSEGIAGIVGSSSIWSRNDKIEGLWILENLSEPEFLGGTIQLNHLLNTQFISKFKIQPSPLEKGTQLTWTLSAPARNPYYRPYVFLKSLALGKDLERGLKALKTKIEPKS